MSYAGLRKTILAEEMLACPNSLHRQSRHVANLVFQRVHIALVALAQGAECHHFGELGAVGFSSDGDADRGAAGSGAEVGVNLGFIEVVAAVVPEDTQGVDIGVVQFLRLFRGVGPTNRKGVGVAIPRYLLDFFPSVFGLDLFVVGEDEAVGGRDEPGFFGGAEQSRDLACVDLAAQLCGQGRGAMEQLHSFETSPPLRAVHFEDTFEVRAWDGGVKCYQA